MTRPRKIALALTLATIAWYSAPLFGDYGVAGGLLWLGGTLGFVALCAWLAEKTTRHP